MNAFLDENFLLHSVTARRLYHDFAKDMPIIDYHCHLAPEPIAKDDNFENLTKAWLNGDHYKWRAMRSNGVEEAYCTGKKTDWEKFQKWAETVPYTIRNPLYHWTHLELRRYFDIYEILEPRTASSIYASSNALLQTSDYSIRNLLRKMNVRLVCTTDDPVDDLVFHRRLKDDGFEIHVLPTFRPDAAMRIDHPDPDGFTNYLARLEKAADLSVGTFRDFLDALKRRHDFFDTHGCSVSDHGLDMILAEEYTESEVAAVFQKARIGKKPDSLEAIKFKSAMLVHFAEWDWEAGWVQQFHLGALRDNNSRMKLKSGPDSGWDSIGDFPQGRSLSKFLNGLDSKDHLARTILYNSNPSDNALMATMAGNFNDGSIPGKVQWGSAWWFLDQKDGMIRQLNDLSNMGLLSRFVGMLTDSRSFLSYPRHEYFRRLLCDLFGAEMERGELPDDERWIGKLLQDICFNNAKNYFSWQYLLNESVIPEKNN